MSDLDYTYYIVEGDPLKSTVRDWFAKRDASLNCINEFKKSLPGCGQAVHNGDQITGFTFEEAPPKEPAWRKIGTVDGTSEPFYMPYAKTKAGKALRNQIRALNYVSSNSFSVAVLKPCETVRWGGVWTGFVAGGSAVKIRYATLNTIDGVEYLGVPIVKDGSEQPVPLDGARPIKSWEFLKIKEESRDE